MKINHKVIAIGDGTLKQQITCKMTARTMNINRFHKLPLTGRTGAAALQGRNLSNLRWQPEEISLHPLLPQACRARTTDAWIIAYKLWCEKLNPCRVPGEVMIADPSSGCHRNSNAEIQLVPSIINEENRNDKLLVN